MAIEDSLRFTDEEVQNPQYLGPRFYQVILPRVNVYLYLNNLFLYKAKQTSK